QPPSVKAANGQGRRDEAGAPGASVSFGTSSASAPSPDPPSPGGADDGRHNRDSVAPGKGESAPRPAISAIVAARLRRLTVSATTGLIGVPGGGMTTRGTCSSV